MILETTPFEPSPQRDGYLVTRWTAFFGTLVFLLVTVGAVCVTFVLVGTDYSSTFEGKPPELPGIAVEMHLEPKPAERFDMNTDAVIARLIKDADTKNMKEILTFLTAEPHLSGTDRSEKVVVDYILKKFKDHGLDTYEKVPYDILNQYPDPAKPNKVTLLAADKTVLMDALMHEKDIPGIKTAGVPAYLAYAKAGTVEADVIFVNKGTHMDFDKLEAENISVAGHICLSQYGGGHRGNKIRICAERGGIGTILFADPKSIAHDETVLYPNSSFMPGTAIQRGALYTFGDPETPGYPSIKEAMRMKDSDDMPKIPAQVIGSDDAKKIVDLLGGKELFGKSGYGTPYKTGPMGNGLKVRLEVNNKFEVKTCYNIIGTIKGAVEPDRYSVTGTHHDAWLYGAVDPSSATAALIELTRLLGEEVRRGWRPRRTMVFCIWGAEEIAIAGSQEWVEDKFLLLHHGAVGYTNVDNCVSGTMFFAYASPPFTGLIQEATKVVPFDDKQSLYEMWTDYVFNKANMKELPIIVPHGGADNNAFNHFAGVPAVAFTFRQDGKKYGYGSYPSYHTAYETLHLYETYYDPKYKYMSLCTKLFGVLSVTLAESYILPYNFSSVAVRYKLNLLKLVDMEKHLNNHNVSLDWLKRETDEFAAAAVKWHNTIDAEKQTMSDTKVRMLNDRMLLIEKAFLKQEGVKDRPTLRHIGLAPQLSNAYAGTGYPVIHDTVYIANRTKDGTPESKAAWEIIRRNINDCCLAMRNAKIMLDTELII